MNIQPMKHRAYNAHGLLSVHSIFYTIQGEGPFTGHRAVFVRLADCNLQCPNCDTDYTSHRELMLPGVIVQKVVELSDNAPVLVVITGGEPLRQEITDLCKMLIANGNYVQIETNGTLPPPSKAFEELTTRDIYRRHGIYIVCSPKTQRLNKDLLPLIGAFKYVVRSGDMFADGLPCSVLDSNNQNKFVARPHDTFFGPVYIQPEDQKDERLNKDNLVAALSSCMEHGHVLQVQIHKLIGVE